MANHKEFDRVRKRLDGRHLTCKVFYDFYMNKMDLGTNEVYLKKDVEDILNQLKIKFGEQDEEMKKLKLKAESFELENYKLTKKLKKDER
jgi:hypothetical protein